MRIKFLIAILFIAILEVSGFAENKPDTKLVSFSDEKIEEYKNQKGFQYDTDQSVTDNAWRNFKNRVINLIKKFFSNDGAMPAIRFVLLTLILLFILFRIFGMKANSLFNKRQSGIKGADFFGEVTNITAIDFEDEAKLAFEKQDLRLAVRYLFLLCLQLLETNQHIKWQIEKTNSSYLKELKGNKLFHAFREIVHGYDFVWYGHFEINSSQFYQFQNKIEEFKTAMCRND